MTGSAHHATSFTRTHGIRFIFYPAGRN